MGNRPQNYSILFSLFKYDKPDKMGLILQRVGVVSLTISFIITSLLWFFDAVQGNSALTTWLVLVMIAGYMVGVGAFLVTGIHYIGRSRGKTTLLASALYVLKRTLLYFLLPAIVLTVLLIIWAIVTKQPAFS